MRHSLNLLAASMFLVSLPVEAVVSDNSSVVSEEVKMVQVEGKKQGRDEAVRLNELGLQQLKRSEYRKAINNFKQSLVISREIGDYEI